MHVRDPIILIEGEDGELPPDTSCGCDETQQALADIDDEVSESLRSKGISEGELNQVLHANPAEFLNWVALSSELGH